MGTEFVIGLILALVIAAYFVGANNPPKSVVKRLAEKYK